MADQANSSLVSLLYYFGSVNAFRFKVKYFNIYVCILEILILNLITIDKKTMNPLQAFRTKSRDN